MAKAKKMSRFFMPHDLVEIARRAMHEKGLITDFPPVALKQAERFRDSAATAEIPTPLTDLRDLPWTSIDNDDSRDLDQLEAVFREGNELRLLVAVADVDFFVVRDSPIDAAARINTTSVYTGVIDFPMLPERLSCDLTSLLAEKTRRAVVIETRISPAGHIAGSRIFPALVKSKAQLAYDTVSQWLEGKAGIPDQLAGKEDLRLQLTMQDRLAQRLRQMRLAAGALEFAPLETRVEMAADDRVKRIVTRKQNRAERIIEELMVVSNQVVAEFLAQKGFPVFSRVVREPERWEMIVELAAGYHVRLPADPDARALAGFLRKARLARPGAFGDLSLAVIKLIGRGEYHVLPAGKIPEGHFGLALKNYAHSTAPNRRYPDLLTQRLLKAAWTGRRKAIYPLAELQALARHCTLQEDAANKVERQVKKCAAAELLADKIGCLFSALVTGAAEKGTWVRIKNPPVEGKLVRGSQGVTVGDRLRVKLVATDVANGFIDFARA